MSGIEINKLTNAEFMKNLTAKCDANGDGKIDGEETAVFQEMTTSIHGNPGGHDFVTIGGVQIPLKHISSVEKDNDNYTVTLSNGVTAEYKAQKTGKPTIFSHSRDNATKTTLADFKDSPIKLTGTNKNDEFIVADSLFSTIDGKSGNDRAALYSAEGISDRNDGKAIIKTEKLEALHSSNFIAKSNSGKVEVLTLSGLYGCDNYTVDMSDEQKKELKAKAEAEAKAKADAEAKAKADAKQKQKLISLSARHCLKNLK